MAAQSGGRKIVANNKKAFHDYFVDDKIEAGVQLCGTEVKSVRNGAVNMKDSYCYIDKSGEMYATGIHISPYDKGNIFNHDPLRDRKLLLHRREIDRLFGLIGQKGVSVIPLCMYFSKSHVKIELGICRGKKLYDKRETDAKKQAQRDIERYSKTSDRY